jgi:hypothetical protein
MRRWVRFSTGAEERAETVSTPPSCLHQTVDRESAQQTIESGCIPWPKAWGIYNSAEHDVAADSQAQRKNDLFSHHRND